MSGLASLAAGTMDPERVRTALARIAEAWPAGFPPLEPLLAQLPIGARALPDLLAISPVSAEKIIRDPAALLWLSQPAICAADRGPRRMRAALDIERPPGFDPHFRALRRVKAREMLRIALRDVARLSTLEQTTAEITCVAQLCLREVCDCWLGELTRRWGVPETDFCIIGMGKLGGGELNYSSDIDVIFLYGDEGSLNATFSYHEFFTRLAGRIIATFTEASADGALFRIDTRLRPEGNTGPLVRSLESTENYYAGYGETWERMALSKARAVAGSEPLFYEFSHRLQPFIYSRSLSADVLDEVAVIKSRIDRQLARGEGLQRNVKLGHGGIREIEFVAQALQLLHGARHAFLQERNTLKALRALRQLDFLDATEMDALAAAYRFLRDIEHRLQIQLEEQTHTLPEPGPARLALARSLGFTDEAAFDAQLRGHTDAVHAIFEKFLRGNADRPAPARDIAFFEDSPAAERELAALGSPDTAGHVAPRSRKLYARLEPLLLDRLRSLAEPDAALRRFVRFVERYGIRGLLFETLISNPRLLDLLLRLFDSSRFLAEILIRRPQLLEETARTGALGRSLDVPAHLAALATREESLSPGDWTRVYKSAQMLRIALRDILGFAAIEEVQREFSALAEACLLHTIGMIGATGELTVIAMGKFGGGELSYGCDLDLLFIGPDPAPAAALIRAMTLQTGEGILYPIDTRLRPEGEAGLLATPLDAYRQYFAHRAQLWEAQALTKARPIAGPGQAGFAAWALEAWAEFARREDVLAGIRAMHARVVRERAGADDLLVFKPGRGGLMELEFHIQALQMRHAIWQPNTLRALDAIATAGLLDPSTATGLAAHYRFLRKCEAAIRRMDNSSISLLPADRARQRHLALRLGFPDRDHFLAACQSARVAIHAACAAIQ